MPNNGLNPRQERFVQEYILDLNATQAAIRAGYSERTAQPQASRLLRNVMVKAEIDRRLAKVAEKMDITAERVFAEVGKIAFSDMDHYVHFDGKRAHLDFSRMPEGATAAIMEIQQEALLNSDDEELTVLKTKFKLHPKVQALDKLGKHFGLFPDKVDVNAKVEVEPVDMRELGRRIAYALRQAEKVIENPPQDK